MGQVDQTGLIKPVHFVGDSRKMIKSFPIPVRGEIGYALDRAQRGKTHPSAKPLKGILPAVMEIVAETRGDTFRAIYTVKLAGAVYVLHAFQKKSKKGISTPKTEIELIRKRLKRAIEMALEEERNA